MKQSTFYAVFLVGIGMALFAVGSASAALSITSQEITFAGGVTCDGTCDFSLISGTGTAADPYKLAGGGTFLSDGNPGTVTAEIAGTISLDPGDQFHTAWNFSTNLSGGAAGWNLAGQITVPAFGTFPFSTTAKEVPVGTDNHEGSFGFTVPSGFSIPLSTFAIQVVFDWIGNDGDTFTLDIPENSIDLDVRQVPEPATLLMLGLGGLLVMRKRWG